MRLGRSITTIGAAAALVAGGVAVSTPALADTTADGFTLDAPASRVVDPNSSITVTGSGCGSADNPGKVRVALTDSQADSGYSTYVEVDAGTDGTWTATLDLSTAVAEVGGDSDVDPWYIAAQCNAYNIGESEVASEAIILDGTSFDGSYIIHGSTAGQQSFEITASGLTPGETATATLIRQADSDSADATPVATIGSGTVDADGNFSGTFPAPSVPDGTYVSRLTGSRYGEGGDSVSLITVTNGVYSTTARSTDDPSGNSIAGNGATTGTDTTVGTGSTAVPTVAAAVPAKASGKELAKTGTEGLTFAIVAAGLVASGAVLLRARRRA
ncbi:LPXTG cell wall anchor domain-containing protein [Actinomyces ruminicola]|uniref:LPXTG-motif cell wall anchor domain-containing protein n=1 Tax=Actinomyces ruminicola TaxID=332524 RepID=A0A1G9WJ44_9ACTO|nr:LPXTG cell wall anchor domain-containing protein [Actinomyces ruminicola]SDM84055.1 LPXTG-motif cell wall anchor domain-containing protein [Actinomyces ruminicola]